MCVTPGIGVRIVFGCELNAETSHAPWSVLKHVVGLPHLVDWTLSPSAGGLQCSVRGGQRPNLRHPRQGGRTTAIDRRGQREPMERRKRSLGIISVIETP